MTDRDEQLLQDFFLAAREMQIEDRGFTERVMQSLPTMQVKTVRSDANKYVRLSHLWTAVCLLLATLLFFVFDGWASLLAAFVAISRTLTTQVSFVAIILSLILGGMWILTQTLRREENLLYQL